MPTDRLLALALQRRKITEELVGMQASETEDRVVGYLDVAPAGYRDLLERIAEDSATESSRLLTQAFAMLFTTCGLGIATGYKWTDNPYPWLAAVIVTGLATAFLTVRWVMVLRNGYGFGARDDLEDMAARLFGTGIAALHFAVPGKIGSLPYGEIGDIRISTRGNLARVGIADRAGREVAWLFGADPAAALAFAEDVNLRKAGRP